MVITKKIVLFLALLTSDGVRAQKTEFRCPEEFGYYPHPTQCSLYYVCVFGGPLLESCTGGLVYSEDLQTCDWPRNVACNRGRDNVIDTEGLNVHIDYQKETRPVQSSREPKRVQDTEGSDLNILQAEERNDIQEVEVEEEIVQRPDIEAEILRNIDEDDLRLLDAQPSILNLQTHGLQNIQPAGHNRVSQQEEEEEEEEPALVQISSRPRPGSGPSFGEKSGEARTEELHSSDTSELERHLLQSYPGESKHLDDSKDHAHSDTFYYTEWDHVIYDQFQDYDYEVDYEADDQDVSEAPKEVPVESQRSEEILIDLASYPQRLQRQTESGPAPGDPASRCDPEKCRLPDCRCGGPETPGNLTGRRTPQLVILTFDDSLNDLNKKLYESIFHPIRRNPNGCPISATFYVSHEWTDYSHVQNVYSEGHEIASHSISHGFGEQFSVKKWLKEIAGQREILAAYGGVHIDDIRGMRAPFLAIGGNSMYSMLYDANFTYDSSMPIYENKPPSFPYTLDYKIFHDCMIPPCPTKAFPGVWELPLVMWNDLKDGRCSMADACSNPRDAQGVYLMIMQNFQRHFNTNRAPFGLYYHPAWFTTPHHREGFELFLDTITEMEDVWLVTSWQAIQWMRNPTSLDKIQDFKPFGCNYKDRPPRCDKPKVCNLWHKSGVRYMRTCQQCPTIYPWTGKTGVANSLVDPL